MAIDAKLSQAIADLEHALDFEKQAQKDTFYMRGIAKSFEICLEYAWKYFKRCAQDNGLEAFSPKESIKMAGRLKLIDNVELWLDFLTDRNFAVHDYQGIDEQESFNEAVKQL
jgi:nucleotidyltransferase substrate binding protein (TIGR01987 family)